MNQCFIGSSMECRFACVCDSLKESVPSLCVVCRSCLVCLLWFVWKTINSEWCVWYVYIYIYHILSIIYIYISCIIYIYIYIYIYIMYNIYIYMCVCVCYNYTINYIYVCVPYIFHVFSHFSRASLSGNVPQNGLFCSVSARWIERWPWRIWRFCPPTPSRIKSCSRRWRHRTGRLFRTIRNVGNIGGDGFFRTRWSTRTGKYWWKWFGWFLKGGYPT